MLKVTFLLLSLTLGVSAECLSGFTDVGGSCYKIIVANNITQPEAQQECKKFGPGVNLATIRCDAENDAIVGLLKKTVKYAELLKGQKNTEYYKAHPHGLNVWFGFHHTKQPGNFFMDDCHKYRNFAPYEPYSHDVCTDLILNHNDTAYLEKWSSLECSEKLSVAVCEDQTKLSGGACNIKPCEGSIYCVSGVVYAFRVNDTIVGRDSMGKAPVSEILPVPASALEKTVTVKTGGGFLQQFFTFNAYDFLKSLIDMITGSVAKCQDLKCKELREKEAAQKKA